MKKVWVIVILAVLIVGSNAIAATFSCEKATNSTKGEIFTEGEQSLAIFNCQCTAYECSVSSLNVQLQGYDGSGEIWLENAKGKALSDTHSVYENKPIRLTTILKFQRFVKVFVMGEVYSAEPFRVVINNIVASPRPSMKSLTGNLIWSKSTTGANFTINESQIYGQYSWLQIWQKVDNSYSEEVVTEMIPASEKIFRELEAGEYQVWFSSIRGDFEGVAFFTVKEDEISKVEIPIRCFIIVDLNMHTLATTPSGNAVVGHDIPVLKFGVIPIAWTDYSDTVVVPDYTFRIHTSNPSVIIEKAHLYLWTLAGWHEIAIPGYNNCWPNGCNYFNMVMDPFAPLYLGAEFQYLLTLDILGANPGDVIIAEVVCVAGTDLFNPKVRFNMTVWPIGRPIML